MELTEVPTSIPDKGVSVKVAAAGVCHSDLHVLEGEVIPPPEGFILGHEVSGWVVEFGPVVKTLTASLRGIPSSCLG